MVPILERRLSRGDAVIEVQKSSEPLGPADAAADVRRCGRREGDDVPEPLVMTLGVVVNHVLVDDVTQMPFAERNDVPQHSCLIERTNRSAYALERPINCWGCGHCAASCPGNAPVSPVVRQKL
jgi:ferredoxin